MSSSDGLRIKSTKALLKVFVGKGGGSSSMVQNLFLANPCDSRGPRFANCKQRKIPRSCHLKCDHNNTVFLEGRLQI